MTIRDLLRHTTGLTYGFFGESPVDKMYLAAQVLSPFDTLQDTIGKLGKLPLLYQPGTRFNYSVSTDVLGHIVERASGQRLDRFFRQRILDPLDMHDTTFYVGKEKTVRFANNYSPTSDGDGLRISEERRDRGFSFSYLVFRVVRGCQCECAVHDNFFTHGGRHDFVGAA